LILDLSHSTSSTHAPRILIAEKHVSTVDSLIQTCVDRLDFDVCTSHHSAVHKLAASPYQLIISSVPLAEADDFFLLRHTQSLDAGVPVVITAATGEKMCARQVLEQGAFDLLPTPLEHDQTGSAIRLALWYNKLNALIASRSKTLERYRQIINGYPGKRSDEAFQTMLTSIEQSISIYERNIHQIETSLKRLNDMAKSVKNQVRELAWKRLDRLHGTSR